MASVADTTSTPINAFTAASTLAGKRVLLGVSAGIAAYKSALLVRLLKQAGCEVRVVMTDGAQAFITPLTLQALSGEPVRTSLLDPEAEAGMGHIELARWADIVLIAPATADLIHALPGLRSAQADCPGNEPGDVAPPGHSAQCGAAAAR